MEGKNPRVRVAGVLKNEANEILLIEHKKNDNYYWLLPGGGVDYGETIEASLVREFVEECGIEVEVGELLFTSQGIAPDKSRHIINFVFEVTLKGGNLRVGDEDILQRVEFKKITDNLILYPNMKKEIQAYLAGDKSIKYLGHRWE